MLKKIKSGLGDFLLIVFCLLVYVSYFALWFGILVGILYLIWGDKIFDCCCC